MRFLITGAYGFVGTNLCQYLVDRGHVCDALDVPAAKREGVPYANFYTWDQLADAVDWALYDCVVHLAGKAHDLKKVASEQSYFDINLGLTERIWQTIAAKASRHLRFICFSSSKADPKGNAYGRSKWAAEQFLLSQPKSPRVDCVILRPAMIHGPGNKGNLNLLWGVARRGFPWPLAAFENRRSFTSIGNVCAAVEALAAAPEDFGAKTARIFPIADDEALSTNRLIELMAEAAGRRARRWRLPKALMRLAARLGDFAHLPLNTERLEKLTEDSRVDNSELKAALHWTQMPVAAEAGLRTTLQSFGNSR